VKHLLCVADCETKTIGELFDLLPSSEREKAMEKFMNLRLGYTESTGSPSLREAIISSLYGANKRNIQPQDILIHSGQEGILLFINSVLSPEDHCIVQWPIYMSHYNLIKFRGCEATKWSLNENTTKKEVGT